MTQPAQPAPEQAVPAQLTSEQEQITVEVQKIYSDDQRQHLQMVQDIITRMGTNSFTIKALMGTIVAVCLALYVEKPQPWLIVIPTVISFAFWILDTYYLRFERKFRGLYNDVRNCKVVNYSMNISPYTKQKDVQYGYCNTFLSATECGTYIPVILCLLVMLVVVNWSKLVELIQNFFFSC